MSADNRTDLPPISSPNFLEKVREALSTYLGNRGDRLNRGLTVRDLADAGLIALTPGFTASGGRGSPVGGPGLAVTGYVVDLTPAPTPTGFTASAAFENILVQTDAPNYQAGNGHGVSRLYGSTIGGATFDAAQLLMEYAGPVASYPATMGVTYALWVTWVTKDGVESVLPAPANDVYGLSVSTGMNISASLGALTGQLTASQLHMDLGSRIDLIDGGVAQPALPYPLAQIAALQDGLNNRVRADLDATANSLLQSVTTISTTLQTVRDAGIYTDPGSGTVKIFGLEAAQDHLTTVDARLDAAEGSITLKASTTYVNDAIAAAVLTPADLLLFDGMSARIGVAEVDINALESSVSLKASDTALSATNVRVTTAETDIDALQGQITLKVDSADFSSVTGGLDTRVGTAETTLAAFGEASSISSMVMQGYKKTRDDDLAAQALLTSILNGESAATRDQETLAIAREELTAFTVEGLSAEAAQRITLQATVDGHTSAIQTEATTRATQTGDLYAQYTVKLDVDGKVSGFGLASTGPTGAGSAFEVRADKFSIAAPSGAAAGYVPFTVLATEQVIGGVTFSAGVYAQKAFIQDAQITNAKIANLAVDSAKVASLSAAKLTAGSIAVGQTISSTGEYSAGVPNWSITGAGLATLNNAVVRGTVYATDGSFTGHITGSLITGSTVQTAETGQRVQLDSQGLLFLTGATPAGKYGSFKYGVGKYGTGVLVYFNNVGKKIPFYVNQEPTDQDTGLKLADIHLTNRTAAPNGPAEIGDICCVDGKLMICTTNATPGTWVVVGSQT
jgi:hypothetical protein